MAAKKDFTQATPSIYAGIATSTADTEKTRRTYTAAEAEEYTAQMKTAGRKGLKAQRINMAFAPDVHDYIKTISRAQGMTITEVVNKILAQHMEAHQDTYKAAKEFIEKLEKDPII